MSGPCNERGSSLVPAGVIVRDFTASDQPIVRELVLAGLADHWGEVDASLNPDIDDIAASYADGCTLVAELDGTIVGTGTVVPRDAHTAEIVRMSVAAAARGRGIGRVVVDELARRAAGWGATRLVLETTADWHETVAFYRSCGFEITHYDDGRFGRDAWFERAVDGGA